MKRALAASLLFFGCGHDEATVLAEPEMPGVPHLTVTSSSFAANATIPIDHTCEGADVAPPLAWSGAPPTTKSFAVIVDDPDAPDPAAPKRVWVHWVLTGITGTLASLPIGASITTPAGTAQGKNEYCKATWNGPCPPIGRHRYFFKVYALDGAIGSAGMTKPELLAAMKGHILAMGQMVGTYQKQPK